MEAQKEYCPEHGLEMRSGTRCDGYTAASPCQPDHAHLDRREPHTLSRLPSPSAKDRFVGAGLEILAFFTLELIGTLLSGITFFLSGMLTSVLASVYVLIRDLNGGEYSLGKFLTRTRVADIKTGDDASTLQCLQRNGLYILGWLLACLPAIGWIGWIVLTLTIVADLLSLSQSGWRWTVGDRLAGTQLVPIEG